VLKQQLERGGEDEDEDEDEIRLRGNRLKRDDK
jgi:hypothetical protein